MTTISNYYDYVINILEKVKRTQSHNIEQAAEIVFKSIKNDKQFFVTGTGHSHMIAEEFYIRSGGFAQITPILPSEFMLHEHPLKSTKIERISDYAKMIVELYKIENADTILIASNSGRNGMIIELAILSKELGANIIALTNLKHSMKESSRHSSGKRLYELADIVIDNCGDHGDSAFKIDGLDTTMGATSTITGAFIAQSISILLAEKFIENDMEPPIFKSSNMDGGDEWNKELFSKYYNV